jgi:hypothetical protein
MCGKNSSQDRAQDRSDSKNDCDGGHTNRSDTHGYDVSNDDIGAGSDARATNSRDRASSNERIASRRNRTDQRPQLKDEYGDNQGVFDREVGVNTTVE